jgi:hypothetical protein
MKRETAEELTKTFLRLSTELNGITVDYQLYSRAEDPDYLKIRSGVGRVLGYFYTDIMMAVFREFPDLEPVELCDADE